MGSFYFTYEKFTGVSTWWFGIGVVPGTTSPGSVTIEWVKLEKGAQATNYTPKSNLDELNECRKYYIKYPSWQMLGSGYIDWEGKQAHVLIPVGQQMRTNPTASTISCKLYCGNGSIISWGPGAPVSYTHLDGGDVAYECLYRHYCIVTSIGKKLVSTTSHETGETTEVMCLYVTLEQRTYVEQKLYEMGVS